MISKTILSFFSLIFLCLIINSVFAIETLTQSNGTEIPVYPQKGTIDYESIQYQQQLRTTEIIYNTSLIASLIIGVLSIIFIIKKSPRIINLIIQGIVFIISLFIIISIIFTYLEEDTNYLHNIIWVLLPHLLLIIFSSYLLWNLIIKEDFTQKRRFTLGLYSGIIIACALAFLATITLGLKFDEFGFMRMILVFLAAIGSSILGVIGLFIDNRRNNQIKK